MAREFTRIWFGGAGDRSEKQTKRLHKLLNEGLSELSGIQQPAHSESESGAKQNEEQCEISRLRIREIAADLFCALIGEEILTEDDLELAQTKNWELGILNGLDRAATILEEKAAVCFINKKDETAHLLRNLADELNKKSSEERKKWNQKYPSQGTSGRPLNKS